MTRIRYPVAGLLVSAAVLTGCENVPARSTPPPAPSAAPSSSWIPAPEQTTAEHALAVYKQYWELSEQAEAKPRAEDWRPAFVNLMADPALTMFVDELANLSSVPAHSVGEYHRSPKVQSVSLTEPARVVILDCLDATDEHLVSDKPGEQGKNLDNPAQPRRYRLEVQVVRYPAPYRWLVQVVAPHLEESC
ncbi:hypothetical protein AB0878_46325 [Amycolatopsis sp. NPDC047767]|uniref:hypothetical protein n=1 Tax=Amycolatopsis sp. NPDC047767 TaxID=3156765 RepID=UPI0034522596